MAERKQGTRQSRGWTPPSFSQEELQFDPAEFMVPSADTKGHSAKESFRMLPAMDYDMDVILSDKRFPYKTKSDIVRHAVARHLAWLHQLSGNSKTSFLGGCDMITELVRRDEEKRKYEETCVTLFARADELFSRGDKADAIDLLASIKTALVKVADCAWRRRILDRLYRQYGRYLAPLRDEEGKIIYQYTGSEPKEGGA